MNFEFFGWVSMVLIQKVLPDCLEGLRQFQMLSWALQQVLNLQNLRS